MKKAIVYAIAACFVVASQSSADLDLSGGNIWIDANPVNTGYADGSTNVWWDTDDGWPTDGNGLWNNRSWGYNEQGNALSNDFSFAANNNSYGQLMTTVSGLVDGQEYNAYVVYSSKSIAENWGITADFSPITLGANNEVTSGLHYAAEAATYGNVQFAAGENLGDELNGAGSGIFAYRGLLGNVVGDASGTLDVYIDDMIDNAPNRGTYDGIYMQAIPEPATFGLFGIAGIAALFIRRRMMM